MSDDGIMAALGTLVKPAVTQRAAVAELQIAVQCMATCLRAAEAAIGAAAAVPE